MIFIAFYFLTFFCFSELKIIRIFAIENKNKTPMQINLDKLQETFGASDMTLAKILFPDVSNPMQSFKRLKNGDYELRFQQAILLADCFNIPLSCLLNVSEGQTDVFIAKVSNCTFTQVAMRGDISMNSPFACVISVRMPDGSITWAYFNQRQNFDEFVKSFFNNLK